ncbi:leucine rich repeat-containing protein [Cyclospora cayetanensis]|uniref:Leucine rich repeat-containing protein n=1 Tax=Cyclospora cayetanensis TaxID=88456 RepID=A0A1D3D3N8_9EIME|nr:leucine rich repeat-containing protein [Cyclospora cayetanensis]
MTEVACEMTREVLARVLGEKPKLYYRTASLNSVLYIHRKGFKNLGGLEDFCGLKALYADGNAITKIEGLDGCTSLRTLCLNENCIREISGLCCLKDLRVLNLSNNFISDISGLEGCCPLLETLHLGFNQIEDEALTPLLGFKALVVLDLSHNHICKGESIEQLQSLRQLKVLYLHRNPVVSSFRHYRKRLICGFPSLTFLDDTPVKWRDRRTATAFLKGGIEAEKKELELINKEKREERTRLIDGFRRMCEEARRAQAQPTNSDGERSSNSSQLQVPPLQLQSESTWCSTDRSLSGCSSDRSMDTPGAQAANTAANGAASPSQQTAPAAAGVTEAAAGETLTQHSVQRAGVAPDTPGKTEAATATPCQSAANVSTGNAGGQEDRAKMAAEPAAAVLPNEAALPDAGRSDAPGIGEETSTLADKTTAVEEAATPQETMTYTAITEAAATTDEPPDRALRGNTRSDVPSETIDPRSAASCERASDATEAAHSAEAESTASQKEY